MSKLWKIVHLVRGTQNTFEESSWPHSLISWKIPDFLEYSWYPGRCLISWNMPYFLEYAWFPGRWHIYWKIYAWFPGICQIFWKMTDFLEYAWCPGICQISWNMCSAAIILENIRLGFLETTLNSKVWFITILMINLSNQWPLSMLRYW